MRFLSIARWAVTVRPRCLDSLRIWECRIDFDPKGPTSSVERVAAGSVVAMKRSNVRGARGPYNLRCLQRKEGKDEMIKASIDLLDLRCRIYGKLWAGPGRTLRVQIFLSNPVSQTKHAAGQRDLRGSFWRRKLTRVAQRVQYPLVLR